MIKIDAATVINLTNWLDDLSTKGFTSKHRLFIDELFVELTQAVDITNKTKIPHMILIEVAP
jgi:hypothetical protein